MTQDAVIQAKNIGVSFKVDGGTIEAVRDVSFTYPNQTAPSLDDFARLAQAAFEALPEPFRSLAGDVVIRVDDFAGRDVVGVDDHRPHEFVEAVRCLVLLVAPVHRADEARHERACAAARCTPTHTADCVVRLCRLVRPGQVPASW